MQPLRFVISGGHSVYTQSCTGDQVEKLFLMFGHFCHGCENSQEMTGPRRVQARLPRDVPVFKHHDASIQSAKKRK